MVNALAIVALAVIALFACRFIAGFMAGVREHRYHQQLQERLYAGTLTPEDDKYLANMARGGLTCAENDQRNRALAEPD